MFPIRFVVRAAVGAILLGSASFPVVATAAAEPPLPASEPHSYANPQAVRVKEVALDLTVDFERKRLSGTAELAIEHVDPAARELLLDTRALAIQRVEMHTGNCWMPTKYKLDAPDPVLGARLSVAIAGDADAVRVHYSTSPRASGLQWLTPAQTAGKQHPFLFTQSQAIHARSWIPLQDTPLVRTPYRARIHAPKGLRAVMSAEMSEQPAADGAWEFAMPQPIPSYLIALGVGDLKFKSTGPRTGVYAEPSVLDAAAYEFAETEQTMQLAEKTYGPYRWGRYDLLVLPPSFPYGGMENPRLTFVTPTVITGDRKLVALISHELAHSWSGNLVTNATWSDFWLNEGFTTYLTYRLTEAQFGQELGDMERVLGIEDLKEALDRADVADRSLVRSKPAADPDEVFSTIPYERGSLFLVWLESLFGREAFDAFLRGWFDDHAFKSVTTDQFLAYLDAKLLSTAPDKVTKAQLDAWIREPALPGFAVMPESDALAKVADVRAAWLEGRVDTAALPADAWAVQQWQYFLDTMPASITAQQLDALDAQFKLMSTRNQILASSWLRLCIAQDYRKAWPTVESYLIGVGRMRLISPLYRALAKTPDGLAFAKAVLVKAAPGYHPIARDAVERAMTAK
jgi:aminopeptidase N